MLTTFSHHGVVLSRHLRHIGHTKGQFLDLSWPVKLVLTDRFA